MSAAMSYSISVRLRRVISEEGYVSVPVDDTVMRASPEPDGMYRLDPEKVFEEAIRLGASLDTWRVEEHQITVHPIQKAPED